MGNRDLFRAYKNPRNQLRGAQNRAQGAIFEQYIEASCQYYRDSGLAEIEKTPEPFKVTRRVNDYQFQGHFEKKAQPDFKGTVIGGKAIVFEAKHTDSDCIKRVRVTPEQATALDRHYKMGALCFVLVSIQMRKYALVPWYIWKSMKEMFGHQYLDEKDIAPLQVPFNGRVISFLKPVVDE